MRNNWYQARSAFTVIEFIVVVAVVAVLVILLLPKYNEYAERQRRAACANNLRQIGVALLIYANDHTMHLPTRAHNRYGRTWDAILVDLRYLQTRSLRCPSDFHRRPAGALPRSYAISRGERAGPAESFWIDGANLRCSYLANASGIVLVTERPLSYPSAVVGGEPAGWCDLTWHFSAHFPVGDLRDTKAFIKETNYLFLDGHVAWLKTSTTNMFPPNPAGWIPCP